MSNQSQQKVKTNINIKIDIGQLDVNEVQSLEETLKQNLWVGASALKTRGVQTADLVLTFKASSDE